MRKKLVVWLLTAVMVFTSVNFRVLATEADGAVNSVETSLDGEREDEKKPAEETINGNDSGENVDSDKKAEENDNSELEDDEEPSVSENTEDTENVLNTSAENEIAILADKEPVEDSGQCGDNLTWTLKDGTLTISGTGDMYDYNTGKVAPWSEYLNQNELLNLFIEEGITRIGQRAFYECNTFIGELVIPNSVASIGSYAFYGCSGFNGSLIIPNSVSLINEFSFAKCSGFTGELILSDNITNIGESAFDGCRNFTGNLVLPNNITNIGINAFYGCSGFTGSLTIPNSVISIGRHAFCRCTGFTDNLIISNGVSDIGDSVFYGCSGFKGNLTIPDSVTRIGEYAFYGCKGFNGKINILGTKTQMGYKAFDGIPNKIIYGKEGSYAESYAEDCGIPFIVLTIEGQCGDNLFWVINEGILNISGTGNMWNYYRTNPWKEYINDIHGLIIEDGVTGIGDFSFWGCSCIVGNLIIPDSVVSIGNNAFDGCSGLTGDLIIPNSVMDIGGGAFAGCSGFTGILRISNNVTDIKGYSFRGCSGLTGDLIIPDKVSSIGGFAFCDCSGLTGDLIIPNSVTNIEDYAFDGCDGMNNKLIISKEIVKIGGEAFRMMGIKEIIFLGAAPSSFAYEAFRGIEAAIYYPGYIDSWSDVEKNAFLGSLTWIPYKRGTEPWNMDIPEGAPRILITPSYDNNNLSYTEMKGYTPKSFAITFSISAMHDILTGTYSSCDGVKVVITLPEGLSFSENDNVLSKEYDIGTLNENNVYDNAYTDTVYITAPKYVEKFSFVFTITADGYEKETKTTMEVPIKNETEVDYSFHDIQVYAEFPNCVIGINQTCAIMPVMADGDDVIKGEEGWNFTIKDTDIAEIQEYPKTDYGTAVRILGKASGNTKLHIIHIPTGKTVDVPILVAGNTMIYYLSDIVKYTEDTGIWNSGIFTNNYQSTRVDGGYRVTFDAYNQCASAGAVEVYNADNQLIEACEIKKFEAYQTGIKEVAMDGWNLLASGFNGTISSITNSMYTEHTPISFTTAVPDGGYIVITNDITQSLPAALYNMIDIMTWMYEEAEIIKGFKGKEGFTDKAKINVSQEMISAFLGTGYDKSAIEQFTKKITKSVTKDLSINPKDVANMAAALLNDGDIVLQEKNVNLGEAIRDAAIDTGIDVAMDVFNKFSPTGDIIQGMFDINASLNGFMQIVDANRTEGARTVRIDVDGVKNQLVSGDFIVESSDGTNFTNTDLIVADITEDETATYIIYLDSVSQIKIYNISLYQDSVIVQPDTKIRVKVPLPATYNKDKCLIYRVESDGSFTDMEAVYLDNYLVFETEHLSDYILYEKFSYFITFNGNGAISGSMEPLGECLKDTEYVLPNNRFIRNGYKFSGWNTLADGTGVPYDNGAVVANLTEINDGNVILYAQWVPEENKDDVLPEDRPVSGEIPDGIWVAGIRDKQYTSKPVLQSFRVYDGSRLLKEKTDYTVSYKNNTKAYALKDIGNPSAVDRKKAPQIVIRTKGNYAGSQTVYFNITSRDISDETEFDTTDLITQYNKKKNTPMPTLTWNGKKLKFGTDFYVKEYEAEKSNKGAFVGTEKGNTTYKLTLVGRGNFTGERKIALTVIGTWTADSLGSSGRPQILMNKIKVSKIPNQPYTGKAYTWEQLKQNIGGEQAFKVTYRDKVLEANVDYEILDIINSDKVGTAALRLRGLNTVAGQTGYSFVGIKEVPFKVTGSSINKARIYGLEKSYAYTGAEICPSVGLVGIDAANYTVEYQNNKSVGRATVIVKGINACTGTKKATFKITGYPMDGSDINVNGGSEAKLTAVYTKGGAKLDLKVSYGNRTLIEGKDYTLKYSNNKKIADAFAERAPMVTIRGKGDFSGSRTLRYSITMADITQGVTIRANDVPENKKANKYQTKITLYDTDGKTLKAGIDYNQKSIRYYVMENGVERTLTAQDRPLAGTVITVKVKGKGNYGTGEISATYRILPPNRDISKAVFKIEKQPYTGRPITLTQQSQFMVDKKGNVQAYIKVGRQYTYLTLGKDFEVVENSYVKNVNKGRATVTLHGIGEYGGYKTVSFNIGTRSVSEWWKGFFR